MTLPVRGNYTPGRVHNPFRTHSKGHANLFEFAKTCLCFKNKLLLIVGFSSLIFAVAIIFTLP